MLYYYKKEYEPKSRYYIISVDPNTLIKYDGEYTTAVFYKKRGFVTTYVMSIFEFANTFIDTTEVVN